MDRKRNAKALKEVTNSKEICSNFNRGLGRCRNCGPGSKCHNGRRHACSVCGGKHKAKDEHGPEAADRAAGVGLAPNKIVLQIPGRILRQRSINKLHIIIQGSQTSSKHLKQ